MKRFALIIFSLIICVFSTTCKKDKDVPISTVVVTEQQEVNVESAIISIEIKSNASVKSCKINVYSNESLTENVCEFIEKIENGSAKFNINSLKDGEKYYYTYTFYNSINSLKDAKTRMFETKPVSIPVVKTLEVINITADSARANGQILYNGGATINECGFCWSTEPSVSVKDKHDTIQYASSFSSCIKSLNKSTKYYIRAYATNIKGVGYGEVISFQTFESTLPIVTTTEATNITSSTAETGGSIDDEGASQITGKGICWSLEDNPDISSSHAGVVGGKDDFTYVITSLIPDTKYYYRAYATNKYGTSYGDVLSFVTKTTDIPFIYNLSISNIETESVLAKASIASKGSSDISEKGFCWDVIETPTVLGKKQVVSDKQEDFSSQLKNLTNNTHYYVRAYAINSYGIAYSEQTEFTTATGLADVITKDVQVNSSEAIKCFGNSKGETYAPVVERGFKCFTSPGKEKESKGCIAGGGDGDFNLVIDTLKANTDYYVCAYAKTKYGYSYGSTVKIKTKSGTPTVTTGDITSITPDSAICSGTAVPSDNVAIILTSGICWSTNSMPDTLGSHQSSGSNKNKFSVRIKNLKPSTTYFVRAYASTKNGLTFGEQKQFQTPSGLATLKTAYVTSIKDTSAVSGGEVIEVPFGTVLKRGVCWNTGGSPTIADNITNDGSGKGKYESKIKGFTHDTKYYVRAYATTEYGTAYGNEVSFKYVTGAIMSEFSVSTDTKVYFSRGNMQFESYASTWRFAEHQYDVVHNYTEEIDPERGIYVLEDYKSTSTGWVDLFGWGTSNSYCSNIENYVCYCHPKSTTNYPCAAWKYECDKYNTYGYGPSTNFTYNDLTGCSYASDWGKNKITNGGNKSSVWRTLTATEWNYIFSHRSNAQNLFGLASVRISNSLTMYGLLILPDNWTMLEGMDFNPNASDYSGNLYSVAQFNKLEENGAVFLPAGGYRNVVQIFNSTEGFYWTSTHEDKSRSHNITFNSSSKKGVDKSNSRYLGCSVRVVYEIK